MKKWIIFIVTFALVLIGSITLISIVSARSEFSHAEKEAKSYALQENLVTSVDEVHTFQSNESYVTIIGKNKQSKQIAYFIPTETKKRDENLVSVPMNKGISKKEAISLINKEYHVKEILNVTLGLDGKIPVWEISFFDQKKKLNYVYIRFEDGKWIKRILNL